MIPHKDIIKDLGRILFWFPLRLVVQVIPLKLVYLIGGWLGDLDYCISSSIRTAKMSANISSTLGVAAQDARRIVRQNLKMNMRNNLELMKYPKITKSKIDDIVTIERLDRLDAALQKGKGVILMTAHFGAKQMLQIVLGLQGYLTNQIHYHMRRDELTFIQKHVAQRQRMKIEAQMPLNFIPAKGFLRSVFKCLQDNQVLIMAGDGIGLKQHMDKSYRCFGIFGRLMRFPIGPVAIAHRTGAALLPVFVVRRKTGHRIIFEQPMRVGETRDVEVTATYVKLLESYIRQYPWQWEFWEEFDETVLLATARQGADPY